MTAEKYVKSIVRKLQCSGAKRQEIKKQLLSDVSAAMESGEELGAVMQRIGPVSAVAKEFNRNLPEEERKKYVRNKRIRTVVEVIALLAFMIGLAYWMLPKSHEMGKSGLFEEAAVEAQAQQIVQLLDANDFDGLKAAATEALQEVMDQETLDAARTQIGEEWGDFVSFGNVYMSEVTQRGQHFVLVQMNASYENVGVTYTMMFDRNLMLTGIYMK